MPTNKAKVLDLVAKIPKGMITSYGEIANALNLSPRTVGFIMNGFTQKEAEEYPWHRVVNRNGFISSSKLGVKGDIQKIMLQAEGLKIKDYQIIDHKKYWFKFI